jgi:hypothetical protein
MIEDKSGDCAAIVPKVVTDSPGPPIAVELHCQRVIIVGLGPELAVWAVGESLYPVYGVVV